MKKRFISALILVLVTSLTFVYAGGNKAASGEKTIGLAVGNMTVQFESDLYAGVVKAATEAGYNIKSLDGQGKLDTVVNGIDDWISTKSIDALIMLPPDSDGIVPTVQDANRAGIPVMTLDSKANGGQVIAHIGSDNYQVGQMGGQYCLDILKEKNGSEKGTVVVVGYPQYATLRARAEGAADLLKKYSDIKIIERNMTDNNPVASQNLLNDVLQSNPRPGDIDVIFAANSSAAIGAIGAQEAANRTDFFIVGVDDAPEEMAALKKPTSMFRGTIVQFPSDMGRIGIETLTKYFAGQSVSGEATPVKVVTKENIDEHNKQIEELYKQLTPYRRLR
jgi:ribose transport system substrate-binding protein